MKLARLHALAVLVPVVTLVLSGYLLFTDPSDVSYECPGTTWTLLRSPAPEGSETFAREFFDAGAACNAAAGARARSAAAVMLSGLSLVLVATTADAAGARFRRQHAPVAA